MKVRNAGIGMKVQVKHNCQGHSNEFIMGGLVCTVDRVMGDDYELRLLNPDIDGGFAWVNASDVRRYKEGVPEVPEVQVPEVPQDDIQVGDSVLVGAEGAGNNLVRKEYAGRVCSVVDTSHRDDCVEISHPHVMGGTSYTSRKKYLTKVTPKPKSLTLQDVQVGDWVVCNGVDTFLTKGIAYEVVGFTAWGSLLVSNPSDIYAKWVAGYAAHPRCFNKVLREVNDATPRVVKSGSESTCRSE